MKPRSQKFLQKRKFAMVIPLQCFPFLTMIFWALGGGADSPGQATISDHSGLNLQLPDAHFNTEEWNKLSLYEKAKRDSLKLEEEIKNDPYFKLAMPVDTVPEKKSNLSRLQRRSTPPVTDPNEKRVNDKLEQLYRELNKVPESSTVAKQKSESSPLPQSDPQFGSDVQKLEQMMEMMSKSDENDPEMQRIGGMLDKILDIQHPDRVLERVKEESKSKKGQVFPVEQRPEDESISLIGQARTISTQTDSSAFISHVFSVQNRQNGFFGLDKNETANSAPANSIEAVIHDTQELVAGATVKMRLIGDVFINGQLISKGQFIYGTCAINGERLTITINSIRNENSLYPVSLTVFDMDGLEGIYIPGAITRDAAKQSSDQALQSMQFLTMDQSLSAQAASAGIAAAKGLFSKKVKLVKVIVKAGYKVLLKDENDKA